MQTTNITKEHIIWAYRLFLDREPENQRAIEEKLNCKNTRELRKVFLESKEYQEQKEIDKLFPKIKGDYSLVFMHIPKTGGTTLHNVLTKHFYPDEICPERLNDLKKYPQSSLEKYRFFSGHYDRENIKYIPQNVKIITILREPKNRILSVYYFWKAHVSEVIERENLVGPRIAKKLNLLEFLKYADEGIPLNIDNIQVRTMLGRMYVGDKGEYLIPKDEALAKAIEYLDSLYAFGIMEEYLKTVNYFCTLLGIAPPEVIPVDKARSQLSQLNRFEAVKEEEITPEIQAELERLTELDSKLYDYAKKKFMAICSKK